VLAHGIGGQEDLPLPFGWVVAGSAAALLVSFAALGLLWKEPRLRGAAAGRPLPDRVAALLGSRWLHGAVAGLGLLALLWFLLALFLGPDNALNPSAHVVYVLVWVGLVPASVLLGPVWRWLSPWRRLHAGVNRLARLDPAEGALPLPAGLGWWPAAAGILAFSWLELVYPERTSLLTLRLLLGVYAATALLGGLAYGSGWFARGDPVEAWSTLFGRFSPLGRRDDGVRVLRSPLDGLAGLAPARGLVGTVVVMLGSTSYDGVSGWSRWVDLEQRAPLPRVLVGTLGLAGTVALVGLLFVGCTTAAGRLAGMPTGRMPAEFAHSVLPVALGYVVAHYYSFLAYEGPLGLALLSDPLGTGGNWLGTGDLLPPAGLISPRLVADVQALAIVAGHVCGVVLAHDRAIRLFPRRAAVVGQLPLLVLMVALTCIGLLLLFAA
jgi:hypothetical protein